MSLHKVALISASCALLLTGCGDSDAGGGGGGGGPGGRQAPLVELGTVGKVRFADKIEAVGTAFANESTMITANVTERIVRLNFRDGEVVRRGDIIAELARGQEQAGLVSAEAQAREAQQQLDRLRALQQRGFATNARIDEQTAMVNSARAEANVVRAQIGDRVIRAPFDGVLGLRRISVGATVAAGTEIATISDVRQIKLDFTLPERFLSAVKLGQPIEARAAAYDDALFRGVIEGIDSVVDPATRSVTVRAVLPNPDRRLRPGMLLTVAIISNPREVVAVPELALVAQRDRSYVFKVDKEMSALRTPVVTGARQDGMVEITRGIAAGDRIVAEGVVKVRDGGKVRDADAPAEAGGGRPGSGRPGGGRPA